MGNIVGEGFDQIIIDQINQRQKIYGSINRTNEILNYINNKTGWCRLVSSVDVVVPPPNRNLPNRGVDLAKNFILFNGTSFQGNQQRGGVWPGTDDPSFNDYAYGMGGTNFGLRPMPGITQATIKTETRGSLKTATINIKANNREQFDIIDVLYLRLGYTMLLEWGSSSYFRNNGDYESNNSNSLVNDFLNAGPATPPSPTSSTNPNITNITNNPLVFQTPQLITGNTTPSNTNKIFSYANYPEKIKEKRLEAVGNYDAIIGKVVNFNWTFTKDGTYDITVILRSMGDVIESLKTNILLPGTTINTNSGDTQPSDKPIEVIKSFSEIHSIGKEFYRLQQKLPSANTQGGGIFRILAKSQDKNNMAFEDNSIDPNSVIAFSQIYSGEGGGTHYYIRLGYFLKFLERKIIPYVNIPEVALMEFDTDVRSNIIYLQARQISNNPGICVINTTITFNENGKEVKFAPGCDQFKTTLPGSKNTYGRIMNIYFDMAWILTTMDSLKDKDGKISLYSLLESICDGWNTATGNFNKLEPTVEEKTIRFIDETALPDRDRWLELLGQSVKPAFFDVYGLYPSNQTAGFIKDLSFNTTVPPNLATMITIGATSKGYVVGQDSTALSRMNAGFTDRFKKNIEFSEDKSPPGTSSIINNYSEVLKNYNTFLLELGSVDEGKPNWNQEAIDNFTNTAETFYEYDQAKQTLEAVGLSKDLAVKVVSGETTTSVEDYVNYLSSAPASSIGFLPFDLQLIMDGLSGMKIYQKYTIDTTYLPANYPTSLEFLIKGITNNIQNNEWTTTIESIAIPKNPFGSVLGKGAVGNASRDNNRGAAPTPTGSTPNANRLRTILTSLGYREKGRELSNGGDISNDLVNYAASVFREIKNQLPSLIITVTGGNDAYHQRLAYKSSHTLGQGLDFVISPLTIDNKNAVDKILGGFAAGNQSKIVSFINEYDYPSSAATAGHFHIRIGGKVESKRIATFIAQANKGQLTTYPIV
jgi:hypothetical protein